MIRCDMILLLIFTVISFPPGFLVLEVVILLSGSTLKYVSHSWIKRITHSNCGNPVSFPLSAFSGLTFLNFLQLLDVLAYNFVQLFMVPRGGTVF